MVAKKKKANNMLELEIVLLFQVGMTLAKSLAKYLPPRDVKDDGEIRENIRQPLKDLKAIE